MIFGNASSRRLATFDRLIIVCCANPPCVNDTDVMNKALHELFGKPNEAERSGPLLAQYAWAKAGDLMGRQKQAIAERRSRFAIAFLWLNLLLPILFPRCRKADFRGIWIALSSAVLAVLMLLPSASGGAESRGSLVKLLTEVAAADNVIVGQFVGHGIHGGSGYLSHVERPAKQWGRMAALVGADYCMNAERAPDLAAINKALIQHEKRGGLVTVSCHSWNPAHAGAASAANRKPNAMDLRQVDLWGLMDPGTDAGKNWLRELDRIADGLKVLDRAGVKVLWRPFHEMNGAGFWWCNVTSGPPKWTPRNPSDRKESFIALWRHMHDYFTRVRGLDNLTWVYSTEGSANRQYEKQAAGNAHKAPLYYYPGDDVVDIVGVDYYGEESNVPGLADLRTLGKPVALTEFGSGDPTVDYAARLGEIHRSNKGLVYALFWDQKWSLTAHPGAQKLFQEPWVKSLPSSPPAW